ncbi:MAG: formyltetrahydrofolate deformylase [Candidatus Latescibacteria bacterium]|nr:formyltetrahydrofolate deformylase [Candidatus Latescibacterota bacterium]
MATYILRISCPDEKGLIYRITQILYQRQLNIVGNDEFVDAQRRYFFMRTEFAGTCQPEELRAQLQGALPAARIELGRPRRREVVVLATSESHCLGDLLLRHADGELQASIRAVVSNRPDLESLARRFELPFHCVPSEGMGRQDHEAALLGVIGGYAPEYLVLAKYMRILTPAFVGRFPHRIINIHHSFLPAFAGASPYRQAFARGVKIIGATAHFVDEQLDQGPIIAQSVIPVDHTHSAGDMAQAGRDVEKVVLARALKLVFEDRVFVSGNRTIIFD